MKAVLGSPKFPLPSQNSLLTTIFMRYWTRCSVEEKLELLHLNWPLAVGSHSLLALLARAPKPANIFPNNNPLYFARKVMWQQADGDGSHPRGVPDRYPGHRAERGKGGFREELTLGTDTRDAHDAWDGYELSGWAQMVAEA